MKSLLSHSILRLVIYLIFYTLLIIGHIQCSIALASTMLENSYLHGSEIESIWLVPLRLNPTILAWLGSIVIGSGYLVEILVEFERMKIAYLYATKLFAVAFIVFEISYLLWIFIDRSRNILPVD